MITILYDRFNILNLPYNIVIINICYGYMDNHNIELIMLSEALFRIPMIVCLALKMIIIYGMFIIPAPIYFFSQYRYDRPLQTFHSNFFLIRYSIDFPRKSEYHVIKKSCEIRFKCNQSYKQIVRIDQKLVELQRGRRKEKKKIVMRDVCVCGETQECVYLHCESANQRKCIISQRYFADLVLVCPLQRD